MWHAVSPVLPEYDPILCEAPDNERILVLNGGPSKIQIKVWLPGGVQSHPHKPDFELIMNPGEQKIVVGSLVRAHVESSTFSAIGWSMIR